MILVEEKGERGEHLLVIRQTDHAYLAGFFAREWGNEKFSRPEPNGPFCLAVAEHDNGWSDWELQPTLDPKTHLPHSFMSIPTETHIALYQRGIERLVKVDHYAGLMAVMHAAELYDRARATMPGYSAKVSGRLQYERRADSIAQGERANGQWRRRGKSATNVVTQTHRTSAYFPGEKLADDCSKTRKKANSKESYQ